MNPYQFAKRYAPYNRQNEFWFGWNAKDALACPYPKGAKHTAWCLGAEAREDYELEKAHQEVGPCDDLSH